MKAKEETKEYLDRALRVIPLAQKALDVLRQEEDIEVRKAAFKMIKLAVDHW